MNNLTNDPSQTKTIERLAKLLQERVVSASQPPPGVKQIDSESTKRTVPKN
jgi:hypothetical protein